MLLPVTYKLTLSQTFISLGEGTNYPYDEVEVSFNLGLTTILVVVVYLPYSIDWLRVGHFSFDLKFKLS